MMTITPWIAPSILAADFSRLGEEVNAVMSAGANMIHFDVMDNHYVPNLSFGPMVLKSLRKAGIKAPIDVHLMTKPVDALINSFIKEKADWITFHPESCDHVDRNLQLIKDAGIKCGIALNPATSTHCLEYIMDKVDMILVMSVNPGFGGQTFLPSILGKIAKVRELIDKSNRKIRLQVDGGIDIHNITDVARSGADTFVAGSAIFNHRHYSEIINNMRDAIRK